MLDEPARELGPLIGVAAIDGQTRLSILVLGILQVTGYFLVKIKWRPHQDDLFVSSNEFKQTSVFVCEIVFDASQNVAGRIIVIHSF